MWKRYSGDGERSSYSHCEKRREDTADAEPRDRCRRTGRNRQREEE